MGLCQQAHCAPERIEMRERYLLEVKGEWRSVELKYAQLLGVGNLLLPSNTDVFLKLVCSPRPPWGLSICCKERQRTGVIALHGMMKTYVFMHFHASYDGL